MIDREIPGCDPVDDDDAVVERAERRRKRIAVKVRIEAPPRLFGVPAHDRVGQRDDEIRVRWTAGP